jgi:hypothetical protein
MAYSADSLQPAGTCLNLAREVAAAAAARWIGRPLRPSLTPEHLVADAEERCGSAACRRPPLYVERRAVWRAPHGGGRPGEQQQRPGNEQCSTAHCCWPLAQRHPSAAATRRSAPARCGGGVERTARAARCGLAHRVVRRGLPRVSSAKTKGASRISKLLEIDCTGRRLSRVRDGVERCCRHEIDWPCSHTGRQRLLTAILSHPPPGAAAQGSRQR